MACDSQKLIEIVTEKIILIFYYFAITIVLCGAICNDLCNMKCEYIFLITFINNNNKILTFFNVVTRVTFCIENLESSKRKL